MRFPAPGGRWRICSVPARPEGTAAVAVPTDLRLVLQMLRTGSHCTPTTSMGRLFDAVASLLDVRQVVDYEAQAAIELEALAERAASEPWAAQVEWDDDDLVIDPAGWIRAAVAIPMGRGVSGQRAARAFHAASRGCRGRCLRRTRPARASSTVGLTGGVFRQRRTHQRVRATGAAAAGFGVLIASRRAAQRRRAGARSGDGCRGHASLTIRTGPRAEVPAPIWGSRTDIRRKTSKNHQNWAVTGRYRACRPSFDGARALSGSAEGHDAAGRASQRLPGVKALDTGEGPPPLRN